MSRRRGATRQPVRANRKGKRARPNKRKNPEPKRGRTARGSKARARSGRKRAPGRLRRWVRNTAWAAGFGTAALGIFLGARTALPAVQHALRSPRFQLRAVHWIGLRTLDSAELAALLKLPPNIALVDVNVDALVKSITEHARVARVDALRIPPDRLLFRVGEREPIGRIAGEKEGFDASGVRFPLREGEMENLVPVRGNLEHAIPLLRAARQRGVELAGIEVRSAEDVRFRVGGTDSVIRTDADAERALGDWEHLKRAGLVDRHKPGEIDLRFRGSAVFRELRGSTEGGEDVSSGRIDRRS